MPPIAHIFFFAKNSTNPYILTFVIYFFGDAQDICRMNKIEQITKTSCRTPPRLEARCDSLMPEPNNVDAAADAFLWMLAMQDARLEKELSERENASKIMSNLRNLLYRTKKYAFDPKSTIFRGLSMLFRSFLVFSFVLVVVSVSEAQFGGGGASRVGRPIDGWNSNPTNRQLPTSAIRFTAENVRHPDAIDWKTEIKRQEEKLQKPEPQKPEPPKPEPQKPEPQKPEPPKPEPQKPEPPKPEPPKPEPQKPEPQKPEPPKPELPQNYAVLIGVNQYEINVRNRSSRQDQLSFPNLRCCVNDTNALAEILEKGKFAPKENIFAMNDMAKDPTMLPTKKNIVACLARVIASVKDGNTCLVAFSGHGCSFPVSDDKMRGYVCPAGSDVYKGRESGIWNLESLIAVADLFAGLESRRGVKKIAILDACRNFPLDTGEKGRRSGFRSIQVTDVRGKMLGTLANDHAFSETDLQNYQNLFRLTSCSQGQFSYEDEKIRHGIFTKCLLDGLDGQGDINRDRKVSIEELAVYVKETAPPYVEKLWNLKQEPLSSSNEFGTCVLTMIGQ